MTTQEFKKIAANNLHKTAVIGCPFNKIKF